MKIDFAIIGGQKCGSTFLHKAIYVHPEVDMINEECPQLESPDFEQGGLAKLKCQIDLLDQDKLIGIKRPNYLTRPEVPERLYELNNNIKLIVILRNPVERFKAAYFHQMNRGMVPLLSLNKGATGIINGDFAKKYPRSTEVLEFGFYCKYLQRYKHIFGKNLLILTFDELKSDSLQVIQRCYKFLSINDEFIPTDSLASRPQKVNYSLNSTKLLSLKFRFKYRYNNDKTRMFPKDQNVFDKIICWIIDQANRFIFHVLLREKTQPQFETAVRKALLARYRTDIEQLEMLLDRDLEKWKR